MTQSTASPPPAGGLTFDSLYSALRNQARQYLRREQNAHSMSATVLVHEAWMALARSRGLNVGDGDHYVKLVSRVMRNLLIDHARRKRAVANGGALQRIEWKDAAAAAECDSGLLLAVGSAMDYLEKRSPPLAALVELRYFAGFTEGEAAQILGISSRSVRRQWRVARLRLLEFLQSAGGRENHSDE